MHPDTEHTASADISSGPIPPEDRTPAMLVHLAGILLGWLAPLIALALLKDRSAFVRNHTVAALNFQLTLLIATVVGWVLCIVAVGLLILLAVFAANVVFSILAAMQANQGRPYRYPVAIRFAADAS